MLQSDELNKHSLECLRFEADCRELANHAPDSNLHSHYVQMADVWLALSASSNEPRSVDATAEAVVASVTTKGPHIARAILIVESQDLLRLFMVGLLETAGFEAIQASNADEGLSVLARRPDIALPITNVVMPGSMDGLGLAHAVDLCWPSVEIIVVSGKRGLMDSDLPAKSVLFAKPYHDVEILFEIRSLIGN